MNDLTKIPAHVSIIMDGNGRWAKARGKERIFGHFEGVESVRAVLKAAVKAGVGYLSLYAFSEENWNRSAEEVKALMDLMMSTLINEIDELEREGVHLLVLGNRGRLSDALNAKIDESEKRTANNSKITLIVFVSYSGQWDILQAARKMAADAVKNPSLAETADASVFASYLSTAGIPDPDLIIRTSGEQRISNYLLWQAAYSEWYFTDILWPDFKQEQFFDALKAYALRDRRYGTTK